jgi:hypothetical protein
LSNYFKRFDDEENPIEKVPINPEEDEFGLQLIAATCLFCAVKMEVN